MSDNEIISRLENFLDKNGFMKDGELILFNQDDLHFSEMIDDFFNALIKIGELIMYNYDETEAYEDVCGSVHVVTFVWVRSNLKTISMISYITEDR